MDTDNDEKEKAGECQTSQPCLDKSTMVMLVPAWSLPLIISECVCHDWQRLYRSVQLKSICAKVGYMAGKLKK